jgi:hypothetical protein
MPAQVAIDGLSRTVTALRAGDRSAAATALTPLVQPGGETAALTRISTLQPLPRAAEATMRARMSLNRRDTGGNRSDRSF